ncbi:MAG: TVP38/TMEM64 family protein [Candidatus Eremiobacteraeota bacterium]|nr:TVP38/TMEM64 family protein [Candidatus Eremiobacteraeota bacterium]
MGRRLGGLALLAGSFGLAAFIVVRKPEIEHLIRSVGPFAYPVAIVIFAAVASAPFSVTDALAVMNGVIFGPIRGSLINAIGLVFAAIIGYEINRRATHLFDLGKAIESLPPWVKRFRVGSPMYLLAVRVIPGFGGTVATASAAAFRVPLWVHVWTMCAIAIPICTLLAVFGDRVAYFVHSYELRMSSRAHQFYERHRPHFRFHRRVRQTPQEEKRP